MLQICSKMLNNVFNSLGEETYYLPIFFCCNQIASKVMDVSLSDKEIFQCKTCGKRTSIRKGSFWTKSKLPLTVLLALLYFFCQDLSVCETEKLMKKCVKKKAIIQWYNYFRDIMTTHFVNNPVRFDQGCLVHCDETFICGKCKYGRGRIPAVNPRYLFGIYDKNSHKAFIQFVERCDHDNIIPLITRMVPLVVQFIQMVWQFTRY